MHYQRQEPILPKHPAFDNMRTAEFEAYKSAVMQLFFILAVRQIEIGRNIDENDFKERGTK